METLEHVILYATNIGVGVGCTLLGLLHRGHSKFDSDKGISVSQGDGLSSKIIKNIPQYQRFSSVIDHFIAGVGVVTGLGGVIGLGELTLNYLNLIQTKIHPNEAFQLATYFYWAFELLYELNTIKMRKWKVSLNDLMQNGADILAPVSTLYLYIYKITS